MNQTASVQFVFRRFSMHNYYHNDASRGMMQHHLARMIKGQSEFRGENFDLFFEPGDIFYIPFGCRYQSFWHGDNIVWDSFAFTYFPNPHNRTYPIQKIDAPDDIISKIDTLSGLTEHDCRAVGLLYTIMADLFPYMTANTPTPQERIVEKAEAMMREYSHLTAKKIARECSVSESALYLSFKEVRKSTPNRIYQNIRIDKAKLMLTTTDLTIEQISEKCHFSSDVYFYNVFKNATGLTPREYRRKNLI